MSEYYLSIDQGTTSTRALLYSAQGEKIAEANVLIDAQFPHSGWVEQNPVAIIHSVETVIRNVVSQSSISASELRAIGITNQRETTVLWDKTTGEPVYPAIVWQDRRTAVDCQRLIDRQVAHDLHQKTGLLLDPYFSATKIAWILKNIPHTQSLLRQDKLAFGTIDSFVLWHLTDGKQHATDATNASRTLLYNMHTKSWDQDLLSLFEIPDAILPVVYDCVHHFGNLSKRVLGVEIPILAMVGDQQSASIGQGCIHPHQIKATYGTGCFMLINTGETPIFSRHQLLTTVAYQINGQSAYAIEGSIFIAGALIKWLRNSLKLFQCDSEIEGLIAQSNPNSELIFVPALAGLGAPFWDPLAKGALHGLTQDTNIGDILTAGLQGVCYQTRDLIESLKRDYHHPLTALKVDGGMINNQWFLQAMSNILNMNVLKSSRSEATAFGAFMLAALGNNRFSSLSQAAQLCTDVQTFNPEDSAVSHLDEKYHHWLKHIEKVKVNAKH